MKLSVFTTGDREDKRGDPYFEALACYNDLADEVVIVKDEWPENFEWPYIGQQFQKGYERATGDWVIHADLDFFFHENDHEEIRKFIEENNDAPAIAFYKKQFLLVDRFNVKSRMVIAVNKGKFGDRIKFNSGGDLCQPSLDRKEIHHSDIPFSHIPIYNYDFSFKTEAQVNKDWPRFDKARKITYGTGFGNFLEMQTGRFYSREWVKIGIEEHPKYIQDKIRNIKPEQFGYNMWGRLKEIAYG